MFEMVHTEVQSLPAAGRAAFILCELQGVAPSDAAVRLGCSPDAVAGRLSKARRRLMDRLAKHGIAPAVAVGMLGVGATAGLPSTLETTLAGFVHSDPSPALLALATEAVPMSFVRTKLLVATAVAVGGLILGLGVVGFPGGDARAAAPPPPPTPDAAIAPAVHPVVVRGTITAEDGKPASAAVVWAAQYSHGPLIRVETAADKTGTYELKVPPGEWYFWARKGTQGGEGKEHMRPIKIPATTDPVRVDVRMQERGTFKGRLFAEETGQPVVGGKLYLDNGVVLTTDAAGKFELGGLMRRNHEAYVAAAGRRRMRVLFDTTATVVTELDVPVPTAGKIVGKVTDKAGRPIPGAWVGRYTSGSYFSINGLFQACNADGTYEYDDAVEPDQPTRLVAGAPGYTDDESKNLLAAPGKPAVADFQLVPEPAKDSIVTAPGQAKRRVVSGVVKDPTGKPAAGILVRWGYQPYTGSVESTTDADGKYRLTVPDEENFVAILPKAFLPEYVRVETGGNVTVDETLKEGNTAAGVVVDDIGKPIPGVTVVAVTRSPDPRIGNPNWLTESGGHTDKDGRFEVKGVPDGAQFDFISTNVSDVRNRKLNLNGGANTVVLQYGGAVKGKVIGPDGNPVKHFRVTVNFPRVGKPGDGQGGFFAGYTGIGVRFTSDDGTFVLTGIGAGSTYRIQAYADGCGEAVLDRVTAVPINHLDQTEAAVLKAEAPIPLTVTVTADGKPVLDAKVTLVDGDERLDNSFRWGYHDASWENMARKRTTVAGEAVFAALPFNGATVLVQAPGMARARIGWRDKKPTLPVALEKEAVLSGEVIFPAGALGDGFWVVLTRQATNDAITTHVAPNAKGKFRLTELPAGKYAVQIQDSGPTHKMANGTVDLKAGETKEWQFEWTK
jgi:hypothetical protein